MFLILVPKQAGNVNSKVFFHTDTYTILWKRKYVIKIIKDV